MFKILSILFVLISTLTINASAASFIDVPEDNQYYEAIEFLKSEKITNGYADGTFKPDKKITYEEFTIFLIRSFYKDEFGMDIDRAKTEAYTFFADLELLYSEQEKNQMTGNLTWETILRPIMAKSNYNILPYWVITKETPTNDYILDTIAFLEYNEVIKNINRNETPTRGEIAKVIYFMKNGECKKIEYNMPTEIIIDSKNSCNKLRNTVLYELSLIPQEYIDAFNENEWKIYLTNNFKKYCNDEKAIGITNLTHKFIALSTMFYKYNKNITLHEFAHFIDFTDEISIVSENMYKYELNNIAKLTGEYCKTDEMECFAEAFKYILINKNNPEKYKEMEELIPMSLEYIEKIYLMSDKEKINEITEKYIH